MINSRAKKPKKKFSEQYFLKASQGGNHPPLAMSATRVADKKEINLPGNMNSFQPEPVRTGLYEQIAMTKAEEMGGTLLRYRYIEIVDTLVILLVDGRKFTINPTM